MTSAVERWKLAGAIALGAGLALLPFLQFGVGHGHAHSIEAHSDHGAHHGGRLAMVGDYHIELVDSAPKASGTSETSEPAELHIFVSDALRRPLRPKRGVARFGDGEVLPLQWRTSHFAVVRHASIGDTDLAIELEDGRVLELRVTHE